MDADFVGRNGEAPCGCGEGLVLEDGRLLESVTLGAGVVRGVVGTGIEERECEGGEAAVGMLAVTSDWSLSTTEVEVV